MRALILMLWCAQAGATEPCEQLYRRGTAAFDGGNSFSWLSPDGVWQRGATVVARTDVGVPAEAAYYRRAQTGLWADAQSSVAWYFDGSVLSRLSSGGAERVLDCVNDFNNGPRSVWAEYRD